MSCSVLSREEILELLSRHPPLVEGLTDPQRQLQPNGVDLSLKEIALLSASGRVTAGDEERLLPAASPLTFDAFGFVDLFPGCYLVTYNEVLHLPRDLMALGFPRSSLLRCGTTIHTAVWDAGYSGRSQSLLVVYNPQGFRLQRRARLLQLVFLRLSAETREGYQGIFQGENIQ
jgi:dUTP pyrophosphatase